MTTQQPGIKAICKQLGLTQQTPLKKKVVIKKYRTMPISPKDFDKQRIEKQQEEIAILKKKITMKNKIIKNLRGEKNMYLKVIHYKNHKEKITKETLNENLQLPQNSKCIVM